MKSTEDKINLWRSQHGGLNNSTNSITSFSYY